MDVSEEMFPYSFDGNKWDSASFDIVQKRHPDFYLRLPGTKKQRQFRAQMNERFVEKDVKAKDISVELEEMFHEKSIRAKIRRE